MKTSSIGTCFMFVAVCLVSHGKAANILLISDSCAPEGGCGDNQRDDVLVSFLEDLGHVVDTTGMGAAFHTSQQWWTDGDKIDAIDANDLIYISRRTNSGDYDGDDTNREATQIWNSLEKPILLQSAFITRRSRWGWQTGTNINAPDPADTDMVVLNPDSPLVAGMELEFPAFNWGPEGSIGGNVNHTGQAIWPKEVTAPALSEMREEVDVVGQFGDRAFLFEMPPGSTWQTDDDGEGVLGGKRVFMGHWGYDIQTYNFLDFTTGEFLTLVGNIIDELAPPLGPDCDFDANNLCDIVDMDALLDNLGSDEPLYDLDADGTITLGDRDVWLSTAGQQNIGADYVTGDTDFDGRVNSGDLNNQALAWQSTNNPGWGDGDFNGDDIVNSPDLNETGIHWLHGTAVAATVPEPATGALLLISLLGLAVLRRQ